MLNSNQNCIRCPSATNRRVMAVSLIKRKSLVDGGEHLVADSLPAVGSGYSGRFLRCEGLDFDLSIWRGDTSEERGGSSGSVPDFENA